MCRKRCRNINPTCINIDCIRNLWPFRRNWNYRQWVDTLILGHIFTEIWYRPLSQIMISLGVRAECGQQIEFHSHMSKYHKHLGHCRLRSLWGLFLKPIDGTGFSIVILVILILLIPPVSTGMSVMYAVSSCLKFYFHFFWHPFIHLQL